MNRKSGSISTTITILVKKAILGSQKQRPNLIKPIQYVRHVSLGSHLTDHRAIELCIDWAMARKSQGVFRAKQGLEKDPKYKQKIQRIIKRCLVDTLPDNDAREYLNGKLDNIDKHYETLDRLDNEIAEVQEAIKIFNTTQQKNDTDKIQLLDPDQPNRIQGEFNQRLNLLQTARETVTTQLTTLLSSMPDNNELVKNRPLEDCAELLEYVIHKIQRATIYYMQTIKKKINNDCQEIVEQLDKLLDNNDNDAQNIEAIEELQSELNNIDAQKERDFLSHKNSWDILENEKSRR